MTRAPRIRRWRRYLADERLEADTYRQLARQRTGDERAILLQLSHAEERHERHWLSLLGEDAVPAPRASFPSRLLNWAARRFGSVFTLAVMQRSEDRTAYDTDSEVPAAMAADEHIHSEVVRGLAQRHRAALSGAFRAAVFGINDGLVSTCALILGVTGTGSAKPVIIAAGFAGLLAGALSMAAGEYVSVHSQRELLQASNPAPAVGDAIKALNLDTNELELVFRARGDDVETAQRKAREVVAQSSAGRDVTLVPPATGLDEVGTAGRAASSSFCFFALGAFLPLFPYLLPLSVGAATAVSLGIVGVSLLVTGGIVGLLSGSDPVPKAARQLLLGYGAALATYLLGRLIG